MSDIESFRKMLRKSFQMILVLTIGLMVVVQSSACPAPCICKWKGGKQTAECGNHNLEIIPNGIDVNTQVLNFSHNALSVLQSERFQKMELINLQKIYLFNNQLIRINGRAFRGLSNLVELDLSENLLTSIPTETFSDYPSLMRLSLSGNPIRELKTSAFKYLSYLTTLELSNCQISFIEDEAFVGMDNLEWLKLDGNRIRNIRGTHILPQSLNGISLHGNRWTCDCKLIDMYVWLNTYQIPQQQEEPKCFEPTKLQGHAVKSLQIDDLACLPEITPTTFYLEIAESKNISLECKIRALPEAVISWYFQGQILQNDTVIAPNLHLYYFIEEVVSDDSKRSELFIYNANADDNGTFVCAAENSAGRSQANFTIRVIVKEEPIIEEVSFPNELLLFFVVTFSSLFTVITICCCIICKCKNKQPQSSGTKKRKEVTFQLPNSTKCVASDSSLVCSKINGNLTITDGNQQDMLLYVENNAQNISMPPVLLAQDKRNPDPDLINDAESLRRNDGDMMTRKEDLTLEHNNENKSYSLVPINRYNPALVHNGRDMYQVDVHLNPSYFIDPNGCNNHLTSLSLVNTQVPVNYNYKTLPHNRGAKANNSVVRFSNEAEFITQTSLTFNSPDAMRYTAEGCYPYAGAQSNNFPSPPEGYKTIADNGSLLPAVTLLNNRNYCTVQQDQKWPSFLPGHHFYPQNIRYQMPPPPPLQSHETCESNVNVIHEVEEDDDEECNENISNNNSFKCRQLTGPVADSPDEGYVGDSQESSDI